MLRHTAPVLLRTPLPPLALAYHGVADVAPAADPHRLFVRPQDLERQVRTLRRWGYRLVPFGELAERAAAGGGAAAGLAALSFDDGFADNLGQLAPLLAQLQAPATVFVAPGLLGRPHPDHPAARCLTRQELVELGSQVEIGSHTVRHLDLTSLSPAEQLRELRDSRDVLEQLLQRPVDAIAYPYGRADQVTVQAAREAGYRTGCRTTGRGCWDLPLELPRQDMGNGDSLLGLRLKARSRYEPLMRWLPARAVRRGLRLLRTSVR